MATPEAERAKTERTITWVILIGVFGAACLAVTIAGPALGHEQVGIGAAWAALLLIAFGVLAALDWFPSTDYESDAYTKQGDTWVPVSPPPYCEEYAEGRIKQPIATWSDLSFILAGLLVLLVAGETGAVGSNPMAETASAAVYAYAFIAVFMGPASMVMHSSLKNWAGWIDNYSIVLWLGFSICYSVARLVYAASDDPAAAGWTFGISVALVLVGCGVLTALVPGARTLLILILGAGFVIFEGVVVAIPDADAGLGRSLALYLVSVVLLAGASAAKFIPEKFKTREAGCRPESWVQWHAVFHIVSAALVFVLFLYFKSETLV